MDFSKTFAIVTGSSSGIGKHICEQLLLDYPNLKVLGLDISQTNITNNSNFYWIKCDLGDAMSIQTCFHEIKQNHAVDDSGNKIHCSIVINNAGINKPIPILADEKLSTPTSLKLTPDSVYKTNILEDFRIYQKNLDVNVVGYMMVTRLGAQLMNHESSGNIINICSLLGHKIYPIPTVHPYQIAKFGVRALTEATRSS